MSQPKDVMERFRVDGNVALVTGGSKGLGRVIAEALAQAGADTVICSRSKVDCERAAGEIAKATGRRSFGVQADVTLERDAEAAFARAVDRFGKVDILVNSAGINVRYAIEDCPLEEFSKVIATNLTGTWLMCREAARHMKPRKSGSVVNLASVLGKVALPLRTPYCSSKFGVVGMTQALALEWAESKVRCNALCPGPFLTEMNLPLKDDPAKEKLVVGQTALNRWGEMHEITGAALFLASPASTYVTGSSLFVDAGWSAR